jgi:tRNA pseudouridine38-40 synthase
MDNALFTSDSDNLIYKLNAILPYEIAIHEIIEVKENAHARFDAKSRTYQYFISKHKDAFEYELSWLRYGKLNIDLMNKACEILMTYNDFTSFAKLHTDNKTNNCDIKSAFWKEDDTNIIFEITADRFLRNMVRSIVGTMVSVGLERLSLNEFKEIIESKNRNNAGVSVPSNGLFLVNIVYPEELYLS